MDSVVVCDHDQAIAILNSDGVADRLKVSPSKIHNGDSYLVNDRMLLILVDQGHGAVEAHIAQSKNNWQAIHTDIKEALKFIESLGYNEVYTNVRKNLKTTLNLLAKHDFGSVGLIKNEVILKWESKQHF